MNRKRLLRRAAALTALLLLTLAVCFVTACTEEKNPPADTPGEVTTAEGEPTATQPDTTEEETMNQTQPLETQPAATEPQEDPALNVFPTDGANIGIGIFWEPPYPYTTPEQYDWIRDAHITFMEITNREGAIHKEASDLQLKLAGERGIKVAYSVGVDGKNLLQMSEADIIAYISELKKNPTVTDIHVVDEPAQPWVYSNVCAAIRKGGLNPRLNFLPYWATWVFDNYNGHVEDTIIAAGKENYGTLCYDQYPFPYNGGDPDMFYNLNLFREIGLKYDVPTAFYIQSIGEGGNFRRTNGNEIRYHTSAGLAYGLKSMTYFTWWTTGFCDPKDYAIISPYGEKTDIYDDVAAVNQQILTVGPVLARLDALEVYHTAGSETGISPCAPEDVPLYTKTNNRNAVIISLMEDRETGRDYVMLVNKNYRRAVTHEFTLTDAVTHLYNLNGGSYEELDISSGKVELTFQPGGFILLAVGQQDNVVDRTIDRSVNLAEGKAPAVETVCPGSGYYAYCLTDGVRDNSLPNALGYRSNRDTGWVEVDLGRVTALNRVDIYPTGNKFTRGTAFPRDFTVTVSADGESWTTVVSRQDYTDCRIAIPSFTFDTVEARYVRVNVTRGCEKGGFEIAELEVYLDDGSIPTPDNDALYIIPGNEPSGANVALEREVTASSSVSGWEPAAVTDGDKGKMWCSGVNRHATADGEEWIMVDLAYEYDIDRVVLYGRSGDAYFPYRFRIEVSSDGESFTTVYNGECPTQRDGQQPFECPLQNVKARYVRVVADSLRDHAGFGDGHLFSLAELEVYKK